MNHADWLNIANALRHGRAQMDWLGRCGLAWPAWIDFCIGLAASPPDDVVRQRVLAGQFGDRIPTRSARQRELMKASMLRVVKFALEPGARPANTEERLLAEALHAAAQGVVLAPAGRTIELPVLLVPPGEAPGIVADLRVNRLDGAHADDPTGLFVRSPAAFLMQFDPEASDEQAFGQALRAASDVLAFVIGPDRLPPDLRLVWELVPHQDGQSTRFITGIDGPSAGASFALAGLAALPELLPDREQVMREQLAKVWWPRAAVSARLFEDGRLGPVEGLDKKLVALREDAAKGSRVPLEPLFLEKAQADALRQQMQTRLCGAEDLRHLLHLLAGETPLYPDYQAELRGLGANLTYDAKDFFPRDWLTREVVALVARLAPNGGVAVLRAGMGQGKTSMALHWVRESQRDKRGAPLAVDAWAFARGAQNTGGGVARLSADPRTVVAQLCHCANAQLGLKLAVDPELPPEDLLFHLVDKCAIHAAARGAPVVLMIDAVDELEASGLPEEGFGGLLPPVWPAGVVLLLTTRQPEPTTVQLSPTSGRPLAFLSIDKRQSDKDIRAYMFARSRDFGLGLDPDFIGKLVNACDGFFIVASLLINLFAKDRSTEDLASAHAELARWRVDETAIPKGPEAVFEVILDLARKRVERAMRRRSAEPLDVGRLFRGLLALAATAREARRAAEVLEWLALMREACIADAQAAQAWENLWNRRPEHGPSDAQFRDALLTMADLFTDDPEAQAVFLLAFPHGWLAKVVRDLYVAPQARDIHAVWVAWCLACGPGGTMRYADSIEARHWDYVDRQGIEHLLEAGQLVHALGFWTRVSAPDFPQHGSVEASLSKLSTSIARKLKMAVQDAAPGKPEPGVERMRRQLRAIDTTDLVNLLRSRRYQTGLYAGVITTLLAYHQGRWEAYKAELLDPFDIVVRHDFGEAYEALWEMDAKGRDALLAHLKAMVRHQVAIGEPSCDIASYDRETAGYALKHIMVLAEDLFDVALVSELAQSAFPTDRLVAAEMILTAAIAGQPGVAALHFTPRMLDPLWDYEANDIVESRYLLTSDREALASSADPRLAACAAMHTQVGALCRQLLASGFGERAPHLSELLGPDRVRVQMEITEDKLTAALLPLRQMLRAPGDEHLAAMGVIRALMCHPFWHCTEQVTTVLSRLFANIDSYDAFISELLHDPWWPVRYGAVDLSFDIGELDDYQLFLSGLHLLHEAGEAHARVRGLCSDDLLGWVRAKVTAGTAPDLDDPRIVAIVQGWMRTAADSWLLEYLYLLIRYLAERGLPFVHLLPPVEERSLYLRELGAFHDLGHTEFNVRIDEIANRTR